MDTDIKEFRKNKLPYYMAVVIQQNKDDKSTNKMKALKQRARQLKIEVLNLEKKLEEKEKQLEYVLDKIDYLKSGVL